MHAGGLPRIFAGFCSGFLLLVKLPRVLLVIFCKFFDKFFVADSSIILTKKCQKTHLRGGQEAPKTIPEHFQTYLANHFRKLTPKRAAHKVIIVHFWDHLGPAGDLKIFKNRAGQISGPPGRVQERSQIGFWTIQGAKTVPT